MEMDMATIEERIKTLEAWVQNDYTWAAKHWQIVSSACFVLGFFGGHVLWP